MGRLKFIGKRIVLMVPVFLIITFVVYALINAAPGSVVDNIIAQQPDITQEQIDQIYHEYGLDQPMAVRYVSWLGGLLHGDLGTSYRTNEGVAGMVIERLGPTLILTGTALVIAVLIGVTLGILAALKPGGVWDKISSVYTFAGTSFPNFFMALVLISLLSVQLRLLPSMGMFTSGEPQTPSALAWHLVLPAFVLSFSITGNFIKQTRSAMLEVLGSDFIKVARSKGISKTAVYLRHAFRNALLPIVTQIGLMVPFLVGGAVVMEQIFSWPGLGSLMNTSISARDYPAVMGITVVIALVVLVANVVMDIVYTLIDHRIELN